jgi:FlaA1/EpsC-like NDP-sugar epimerase
MAAAQVRVLILGAGVAGREAVEQMRAHPEYGYRPVGFVDDDPAKLGAEVGGLEVLGRSEDIARLTAEHAIDEILIAVPSESGATIRRLVRACEQAKVSFKIVPGIREIILGDVHIDQIRRVEPEDLLGRESVHLDSSSREAAAALDGRTVLVTGAGGSIGAELCRQVFARKPRRLILLGRGENSIFEIEADLNLSPGGPELVPVIADVRDRRSIEVVFAAERPEIVFHAAAHKHVHYMERFPEEAVLRNVIGTRNLIAAARSTGCERLVVVSTDKAAEPVSVMGATKRLAEEMVRAAGGGGRLRVVAVRFGNVLGSRGSVVPLFKRQIARGGPVTVSDPEATRYFMTVREAAALVIQAGAVGRGGEVFVLDMGQPISILELARELITFSGYRPEIDIPIVVTGLRPGERRHESLWGPEERLEPTAHAKIQAVKTLRPPRGDLDTILDQLEAAAERCDREQVLALLRHAVPEWQPHGQADRQAAAAAPAAARGDKRGGR